MGERRVREDDVEVVTFELGHEDSWDLSMKMREAFPVVGTACAKAQRYESNIVCWEHSVWRSGET